MSTDYSDYILKITQLIQQKVIYTSKKFHTPVDTVWEDLDYSLSELRPVKIIPTDLEDDEQELEIDDEEGVEYEK